ASAHVRERKAGGLKVLIPAIPLGRDERVQHVRGVVDRVAAALGIRDVTLLAVGTQPPGHVSAPPVLDRVPEALRRRRLTDDAGVDRLAAGFERRNDRCRAIYSVPLL